MSYFVNNENAQPAARATGRGQSSNAYANGSDQNCGNVITDRSTVRLHAPPGGHSSICFGASDAGPAPSAPSGVRGQSREAAQNMAQHSASGVSSQIFGAPSGGRSGSSNAYANGQDQNNGNFITDRPTTRLHAPPGGFSSISFGGDANDAQQQSRPGTTAAAAKERETRGHDIFGTNNPGPAAPAQPRYAAQQQQQQQESYGAPEQSYEEDADGDAPAAMIEATDTNVKAMMIAELRIMCRDHGLSPAGSKPTLVNRICEAMAMGQVKVMVANRGTSGLSNTVNNYTRSEGQNVGNFMTDRNSSRVLAPPGGGSSFSFGYSDPPPAAHHNVSDAKAADHRGNDIFASGSGGGVVDEISQRMHNTNLQTHENPFQDGAVPHVPHKVVMEAKMTRDLYANNVFSEVAEPHRPGTAQSRTKMAEISGHDIFSDSVPNSRPGTANGMSESRAKAIAGMGGSDVFSNESTVPRSVIGGVRKPPGGGSSIVF